VAFLRGNNNSNLNFNLTLNFFDRRGIMRFFTKQGRGRTRAITKTTLALCLLCTLSLAQKPKVSVYVSEQSGYSEDVKNALRVATMNVLVRGGKYEIVERSSVIDEELSKQASGAVDDDQIVAFGRQAGARYVCVSDITSLGSYYVPAVYNSSGEMVRQSYTVHPHQVSARIIDVETAQLAGLGVIDHDIQSGPAMSAAIVGAVEKMLKTMPTQMGSNLPKKAVYMQGGMRNNSSANALYTYTLEALFTRSRYNGDFTVVERSEAFTRQIDREQGKQHSGSVADGEISRLGKQYGIKEICIASIEPVMGTYNINARLVNVERASVVNASKLRHLEEGSAEGRLNELRTIAISMVEDMIPRRITAEEVEEENRIKAERAAVSRAAWMVGFISLLGGGVSLNMNEIEPTYFKSVSGQCNPVSLEFYRRNLKFFRFGATMDLGGVPIDKDVVRSMQPDVLTDSTLSSIHVKINAFARLYPADFLFLSGGIGWDAFYSWSKGTSPGSNELVDVDVVNVSTPVFPVGVGIYIGTSEEDGGSVGLIIEGLYNILPFKGRTAAYMSINAGFKANVRITEDKKYVKEIK
jgi:hypothetical protein